MNNTQELKPTNGFVSVKVKRDGAEIATVDFPDTMPQDRIQAILAERFPTRPQAEFAQPNDAFQDIAESHISLFKGAAASLIDLGASAIGGNMRLIGENIAEMRDEHKKVFEQVKTREPILGSENEYSVFFSAPGYPEDYPEIGEALIKASSKVKEYAAGVKEYLGIKRPDGSIGGFAFDVGGAFGSVCMSVGLAATGVGSLPIATMWGLTAQGAMYEEAKAKGLSTKDATEAANYNGAMSALINGVGINVFKSKFDFLTPVKRTLARIASETIEEELEAISEIAITKWKGIRKQDAGDIVKQLAYTAVISAIASTPLSAGYTYLERKGFIDQLSAKTGVPKEQLKPVIDKVQRKVIKDGDAGIAELVTAVGDEVLNSKAAVNTKQQLLDMNQKQFIGKPEAIAPQQVEKIKGIDDEYFETLPEEYKTVTGDIEPKKRLDVRQLKDDTHTWFEKAIVPLSTRISEIAPDIYIRVKRAIFSSRARVDRWMSMAESYINDIKKLDKRTRSIVGYAMANSDIDTLIRVLVKSGIDPKKVNDIRAVFEEAFNEQVEQGLLKEDQKWNDYFPRAIRPDRFEEAIEYFSEKAGLEGDFFEQHFGKVKQKLIEKGILKEGDDISLEHRKDIIRRWLLGQEPIYHGIRLDIPRSSYKRMMEKLTAEEYERFFIPTEDVIVRYIYETSEAIEYAKLFGSAKEDKLGLGFDAMTADIPTMLQQMLDREEITADDAETMRDLLSAYFGRSGMTGFFALYRDIEYVALLTHLGPVLSQLQDAVWTMADFGVADTLCTFVELVSQKGLRLPDGTPIVTVENVGLRHATENLLEQDGVSKAVNDIMKTAGITPMDLFMKKGYLNTYIKSLLKMDNAKAISSLEVFLRSRERAEKAINKLRDGILTEDMLFAAYMKLSQVAPTDALESPEFALTGNNWAKMAYVLRRYAIKQFDNLRRLTFEKIGSMDPEIQKEGFRKLWQILLLQQMVGVPVQYLKRLLRGEDVSWADVPGLMADALLNMIMLNRYVLSGVSENVVDTMVQLILPPTSVINAVSREVVGLGRAIKGMASIDEKKQDKGYEYTAGMHIAKLIPVIGDLIRYAYNRNKAFKAEMKKAEKELKKRNKKHRNRRSII